MAREGTALFREAVADADALASEINALPGLKVLSTDDDPRLADHARDPLRLVINVAGAGWTGYDAELLLRHEYHDRGRAGRLVQHRAGDAARTTTPRRGSGCSRGCEQISDNPRARDKVVDRRSDAICLQPAIPPLAMTPREAALGPKQAVPLAAQSVACCAESIMFYPPGIPLLMPGEVVTADILDVCRALLAGGAHCYASDPTLGTMRASLTK